MKINFTLDEGKKDKLKTKQYNKPSDYNNSLYSLKNATLDSTNESSYQEDLIKRLKRIWQENQGALLFVRFTDHGEKGLQINPKYSYDTPYGIYAYPFNIKWIERLKNKEIPFQFNAKDCIIFKWDPSLTKRKTIILDKNAEAIGYSSSNFAEDYKKLESLIIKKITDLYNNQLKQIAHIKKRKEGNESFYNAQIADIKNKYNDMMHDIENILYTSKFNTRFNKIFNLSRRLTQNNPFDNTESHDAKEWTYIMHDVLNISCIYDREDSSTIHSNEPTQAVFFEPEKAVILLNEPNLIKKYNSNKKKDFLLSNDSPNDSPKYKLIPDGNLFRIVALKTFKTIDGKIIEEGQIGGTVTDINNLSQEGSCWINYNAKALDNCRIVGDALLEDQVIVKNNAYISGKSFIQKKSVIQENASIYNSIINIVGEINNAEISECKIHGTCILNRGYIKQSSLMNISIDETCSISYSTLESQSVNLINSTVNMIYCKMTDNFKLDKAKGKLMLRNVHCYDNAYLKVSGNIIGLTIKDNAKLISENAKMNGEIIIEENAIVEGQVNINNECHIYGNAKLTGKILLYDKCKIYGNAKLHNVLLEGKVQIFGDCELNGPDVGMDISVSKNAKIYENAKIKGSVYITDDVEIFGNADIKGNSIVITGKSKIYGNAIIEGEDFYITDKEIYKKITDDDIITFSSLKNQ